VVGQFRAPARYLNLLGFALAILTALALRQLTSRQAGGAASWRRLTVPWAVAIAVVVAALAFRSAYPGPAEGGFSKRSLIGAGCFLAVAALLTAAARGRGLAACALVLFAAGVLYHFCLCHPLWGLSLWKDTLTLAEYLEGARMPPFPGGRCLDLSWNGTRTMLCGASLVNGYIGGIEPKKRPNYQQLDALRLSGAAWYHAGDFLPPERMAGLEAVGGGWHRVPLPVPRVRLVSRALPSCAPAVDLAHPKLETDALSETPLELEQGRWARRCWWTITQAGSW
jgi:hypothetical protein